MSGALQNAVWADFQPGNLRSTGNCYCRCEVLWSHWTIEIVSPLLQEDLQDLLLTASLYCYCSLLEHYLRSSDFMDAPCLLLFFVKNKHLPCSISYPLSVGDTVCILLLVSFVLNFKLFCRAVPKETSVAFCVFWKRLPMDRLQSVTVCLKAEFAA